MPVKVVALIFTLIILFSSCKSATYHYYKFIEKGGKITPEVIKDSIPYPVKGKDGKDTTIYVPFEIKVDCPEVPKTNSQTRQEERTKRKELETQLRAEKSKNKLLEKQLQEQGKTDRNDSNNNRKTNNTAVRNKDLSWKGWLIVVGALFVGIVIGAVATYILKTVKLI